MPFEQRKKAILDQLNAPDNEYTDLSPKGSIDSGIRDLIEELNKIPGLVTTSSCAGRVSVFLEGKKKPAPTPESTVDDGDGEERPIATPGGKGGGRWLFVSHDPLRPPSGPEDGRADNLHSRFKLRPGNRSGKDIPPGASFIHFKFEPMVCSIVSDTYLYTGRNLIHSISDFALSHRIIERRKCSSRSSDSSWIPREWSHESDQVG
jgi:tRNA wybutosine-synthesizing protein 3